MKKKIVKCALCVTALGLACILSGCTHGIGDTASLVKNAEAAKQAAEQLMNNDAEKIVVGTVADPSYIAEKKTSILDFQITCEGTSFHAEWEVETGSDKVSVQIFADTDTENMDGVKIASYDGKAPYDSADFQYPVLEEGNYFCYIKVIGTDGNPVIAYNATPVTVSHEAPEGSLNGVQISAQDGNIVFEWEEDDHKMYLAMIMDPKDTSVVLDDTSVVGTQAKIAIPEGYTQLAAAVASYDDSKIGPYRIYTIDIPETTGASEDADVSMGGADA